MTSELQIVSMSLKFLYFLVLFLNFGSSEKRGKILYSIGEVLRVHQWYFLDEGNNESVELIARYLARNSQFTVISDKFDPSLCKTHGTVIVTRFSFLWILRLIKADAPECTWLFLSPHKPEWLEELPPMRSIIIFYEENSIGAVLTIVQKPCWKCSLLKKSLNVTDSTNITFGSFFSNSLDFLNNSIVDVDTSLLPENCDPLPIHDPPLLSHCYHQEIMEMVSRKISFRPNKIAPDFPEYAIAFPNGSHGILFQQLMKRSIDMSIASLVVAEERMHTCESVWPTIEFRAKIFIKAGQEEIVWLNYLYPFNYQIWLMICGVVAAGSLTLILTTSHIRIKNNQRQIFSIFPAFYTLQVLCLQSLVKLPNLISSRIAYISLLIAAATILPAYSGSLVSYLTTSKQYYPFKTLEEFIADGRFQILTRRNFIHKHLIASEMKNLTSLVVPTEELVKHPQDGFYKLCEGWLAYFIEDVIYTPALQNYPCRISETPVTYLTEYLSISLPKNFPLTEQMRIGNIRARSSGIKDSFDKFVLFETRPQNMDKDYLPVTLFHVAPMFVLLLVFTVLAWVILGLEVMHQKVMFLGETV